LPDLDRAIALRDDAEIFYNRGRVLESLARPDAAIADYQRALALGAAQPEQIQRRLAALTTGQMAHGQPASPAV
jgi:tetratricopeptide (TPR) repeat protein